jgi:hypothetical protein
MNGQPDTGSASPSPDTTSAPATPETTPGTDPKWADMPELGAKEKAQEKERQIEEQKAGEQQQ